MLIFFQNSRALNPARSFLKEHQLRSGLIYGGVGAKIAWHVEEHGGTERGKRTSLRVSLFRAQFLLLERGFDVEGELDRLSLGSLALPGERGKITLLPS